MFKLKYTTRTGYNKTKDFNTFEDVMKYIDDYRVSEEIDTFIIYNINVYAKGQIIGDIIELKFKNKGD